MTTRAHCRAIIAGFFVATLVGCLRGRQELDDANVTEQWEETVQSSLVGEWEWVRSNETQGEQTVSPPFRSGIRRLVFTSSNGYEEFDESVQLVSSQYGTAQGSVPPLGVEKALLIRLDSTLFFSQFGPVAADYGAAVFGDSLIIVDRGTDGWSHYFRREP